MWSMSVCRNSPRAIRGRQARQPIAQGIEQARAFTGGIGLGRLRPPPNPTYEDHRAVEGGSSPPCEAGTACEVFRFFTTSFRLLQVSLLQEVNKGTTGDRCKYFRSNYLPRLGGSKFPWKRTLIPV